MKVNIEGLINRLDSLRERMNYLFEKLEKLDDLEQEEIEVRAVERFFENDDAFNLSIALAVLEQVEKLDNALDIIKEKRVDVFGLINCMKLNEYTALETYNLKENCHNYFLTGDEYALLKEVLL